MQGALGQDFFFRRTQLSDAVQLDEATSATLAHLERIGAFVDDEQWGEAVDTLTRLMADSGDKLIPVDAAGTEADDKLARRYIPLSRWCQMRMALLSDSSPEVLRTYRSRVDPLAGDWYRTAMKTHDEELLQQIVDEMFCSSHADDALLALGEIALERGEPAAARDYWLRISPQLRMAEGPMWFFHRRHPKVDIADVLKDGKPLPTVMAYPDTDIPLANVRARLVLASIYEGSPARAEFELNLLKELHPKAQGKLNGKTVDFHEALSAMLEKSRGWRAPAGQRDWPTFAGDADRNAAGARQLDISGTPAWSFPLGERLSMDETSLVASGIGQRIGESADGLLSVHPIVAGDVLLLADLVPSEQQRDFPHQKTRVRAYETATGKPAWPKRLAEGETDVGVVQHSRPFAVRYSDRLRWGVPRLTMSSHGRYAFARIGSPVTMRPRDDLPIEGHDQIVSIDLKQQGKLLWEPIDPPDEFAFEGTPVSDGDGLFVAMRRSLAQPQSYLAAYDLKTGQPHWRTWLSAAESPALGRSEEVTHNLLTLHDGVLYCNTNLGAVAAVAADTGKTLWATVYPRANFDPEKSGEPATNFQRDVNPCVYWKGLLLVAPSDSHELLCLEAATGQVIWSLPARDIVHILGVSDDGRLLASGNRLWWIDAETGNILARFPESNKAEPRGHGRGALAGDVVYWPAKDALYVFDQHSARQTRQPIDLARRGLTGGNIIVAGDQLIITTADKVYAFQE